VSFAARHSQFGGGAKQYACPHSGCAAGSQRFEEEEATKRAPMGTEPAA
jgi:hypothetical protein